ncbi:MAG: methyl-accepting chemotaxis protein, partial [Pseudomonas sp.]|nr:methyl-accepting chemotaxis protein [Pseudomonas sp.]
MRLKLLTNLNTLLLVAVCLALGATLWWSQQALERPYLLMERYLSLSQHFQNQVARNIEDYLASGDAVRLSEANSALETLQSQLAPLPPALAETVRPSLENLNSFSNTELLAAGKLAGDPQALLLQAERELAANLEQLSQYASEANTPEAPHYLPPLMTAALRCYHLTALLQPGRDHSDARQRIARELNALADPLEDVQNPSADKSKEE